MFDNPDDLQGMDRVLGKLLGLLDELPAPVRAVVKNDVEELLGLLQDRRAPRVMLLGRRGAGKSTLINAIVGKELREPGHVGSQTGKAEWVKRPVGGRAVEILDTRGLQEGSRPAETDTATSAEESLRDAIRDRCPDVILFLVQARQVDSAIAGDLDAAEFILRTALDAQGKGLQESGVKIIPVLTQCDQLDPVDVRLSENDPDKNRHVTEAAQLFTKHLRGRDFLWTHLGSEVIPVGASLYYLPDGRPNPRRDYRWGIEQLAVVIGEVIPDEARLDFVRLARFREVQGRLARRVVLIFSCICGGVGATPIPVADMAFITPLQVTMILVVAYISGREITKETARDFMAGIGVNVGAGFVFREAARALAKFLPGGSALSGAVAVSATKLLGEAAIRFYISGVPMDDVRRRLRTGLRGIEGPGPTAQPQDA